MSITVSEKTHWKERIAQKIERAIKELVDKHDPAFLETASKRACEAAIQTLGGTKLAAELETLNRDRDRLKDAVAVIERELEALAEGKPRKPYVHYADSNWSRAVAHQQDVELQRILSQAPLGQRILKLRSEQESLLDTVWLSTSTVQIRELWKNVTDLLSDELSELQKKVLAQPSIKEDAK